jgi:hypothetical protein
MGVIPVRIKHAMREGFVYPKKVRRRGQMDGDVVETKTQRAR